MGRGVPLFAGEGTFSSPDLCLIFDIKIVSFDAFWVVFYVIFEPQECCTVNIRPTTDQPKNQKMLVPNCCNLRPSPL